MICIENFIILLSLRIIWVYVHEKLSSNIYSINIVRRYYMSSLISLAVIYMCCCISLSFPTTHNSPVSALLYLFVIHVYPVIMICAWHVHRAHWYL